jgi:predicted DNA-binding antitoxin AbrB/MazE fold protein
MTQHVNAIFEHGVLKPLGPLELQDQDIVALSIDKVAEVYPNSDEASPTLYEILDEVGLVGSIEDAPPDLSTNPKYMEGFGKSDN